MSCHGFTSPAVSSTNVVFNLVAIPSGVYRYFKEGRMPRPLAWMVIAGTFPGDFIGFNLRGLYLPDPGIVQLFVGFVLSFIGGWLVHESSGRAQTGKQSLSGLDKNRR